MNLVLAYDGESCSAAALADLARAGLPNNTLVQVVSVADVFVPDPAVSPNAAGFELPPSILKAHSEGQAALEQARVLAESGARLVRELFPLWTVSAHAFADSPAWAVVRQAAATKADLIVLGCHNHGVVHRLLLGSVSQKVLTEAGCSVRIARPDTSGTPPRLLLAMDGSPSSLAAAAQVQKRRWPAGTTAIVAIVLNQQLNSRPVSTEFGNPDDWALQLAARVAADLTAAGVPAEAQVPSGDPQRMLLELATAQKVTCLFVGAQGGRLRSAGPLGSVAAALAARATATVEIIRVPAA